ncbi:hypothetical protein [Streptomyces sp. SID10853]|nr:hypothetical protein [Streptomyces sp. SID10853]
MPPWSAFGAPPGGGTPVIDRMLCGSLPLAVCRGGSELVAVGGR